MQNIYSPNSCYITFRHDDSYNFEKILDKTKKVILTLLDKYMIFPVFWLALISLFFLNYV